MKAVILLILMSKTIIRYGETGNGGCPQKMVADEGNHGRHYCRPRKCWRNKCVEMPDKVTCRTWRGKSNCAVLIGWTVERINSNEISCLISPADLKYVNSIILTQKCFMPRENKFHEERKTVCEKVSKCDLKFKTCNPHLSSNQVLFTCEATSKFALLENEIIAIDFSTKIPITAKVNNRILNNKDSVKAGDVVQCAVNLDKWSSSTNYYVGLRILQKCKHKGVSAKNFCYSVNCAIKIIGYLEESSTCVFECIPWFKSALKLMTMSNTKEVSVLVRGVNNATLGINDGKLKSHGILRISSVVICDVKSVHNLQDIKTRIIIKQECGSRVVSDALCYKKKICEIFATPCKDNEMVSVTCEEAYTAAKNFKMAQNLTLQWIVQNKITNHKGLPVHPKDALMVATSVACIVQDFFQLIEIVTVKQICSSNINEVKHCQDKRSCSLDLSGIIGTINCALVCSVNLIKGVYSKISLVNSILVTPIQVAYPDSASPTIDFQGTVLHNNDVIHVNDTLLTCSLKLINQATPRYIPLAKFRLKVITQCSSLVKTIECSTNYGCNVSIAHCQFLDRVHVTCAEYYSENINRMMLYRRIDGVWGHWYPWSAWNPPCGGTSRRVRIRKCDSPYPKNGGNGCSGSDVMSELRKSQICSDRVHATGWSAWSDWSPCSLSCNTGITVRKRQCLSKNSRPHNEDCVGSSEIKTTCVLLKCAVHQRKMSTAVIVSIVLSVPAVIIIGLLIHSAYTHFIKKRSRSKKCEPDDDPIESDIYIE